MEKVRITELICVCGNFLDDFASVNCSVAVLFCQFCKSCYDKKQHETKINVYSVKLKNYFLKQTKGYGGKCYYYCYGNRENGIELKKFTLPIINNQIILPPEINRYLKLIAFK